MRIRLAREGDYVTIARLHRQTFRNINSKDYTKDQINAWSTRTNAQRFRNSANKCKRWVAVQDDKVVGFCDHTLDGEFWGLYVHKDFIGKGIGSRLLKVAEDSLKKMGFKKVHLEATVTAKEFYKKHGYRVMKKDLHPINNEKLEIFNMSKTLS
jgi:ribosomal protein S18 acetylase RimI-like enzyme